MNNRKNTFKTLYDFSDDTLCIRDLDQRAAIADILNQAIETALRSHPVSRFVEGSLAADLFMQPAISDKCCFCPDKNQDGKLKQTSLLKGKNDSYIEWSLPGKNSSLPKKHGCGVANINDPSNMKFTACTNNKEHFIKALSNHCWRMGCPNCFNDTCLRNGARIEKKIASYADIAERMCGSKPQLKHWVISPPQTQAKLDILTVKRYQALWKQVISIMKKYGMTAGYGVFHPWRLQKADDHERGRDPVDNWVWKAGPHFHILGYGFVDTKSFVKDLGYCKTGSTDQHNNKKNENERNAERESEDLMNRERWLLKQVHPGQEIRSIRQTVGYLLTHAGLGMAEQPFPSVSAFRKGKPKPEAIAYQEQRKGGRDRDIDSYLDILDKPKNFLSSSQAEEIRKLAANLSGTIFGFDTEDRYKTDALAEYEHQTENDTLSAAAFELFCPERPFNILSYEKDSGPKYKFAVCQNEYFRPDYSLSADHYDLDEKDVRKQGRYNGLGRRSMYGPETPNSFINLRYEDPEYCEYGRPNIYACNTDDDNVEHIRWLEWTMKQYTKTFQVSKLFGELDPKHMRNFGSVTETVDRLCGKCGSGLGIYCGCMQENFEPAVFKRKTDVFVRAADLPFVSDLYEENKERLAIEGKTIVDFAHMIPQASTAFSCGLDQQAAKPSSISPIKKMRAEFNEQPTPEEREE